MVICGTDLFSSLLPHIHILSSSSSSTYCSQCLKLSTNLKRCSKCHLISYCSISCQRQDWIYHKYECSYLQNIDDEYDLTRLFLRLIIRSKNDHEIENSHTKRCLNDLQTHENDIRHDKRRYRTFELIYQRLKQWNIFDTLDENIIFLLFCRLVINTLTIHDTLDLKSIGYGLYLDATVYNHSCQPTCHTVFNGIYLSIRTLCDQSTDEWTINYIDLLESYKTRQEFLRENYYFNCQCKRCLKHDQNEIIFLEKIHFEEQKMDKFINENQFLNAYQSSKHLCDYYNEILPRYHAYVSLHHVKHLKLELLLAETVSNSILQSTMKNTFQRVKISMGDNHPLTQETIRLCEEYKLEMALKHNNMSNEDDNPTMINDRPSKVVFNSSELRNELTNLLINEGNNQSLSNLLSPLKKLDAIICKDTILPVNDIRGMDSRSYVKNERYLRCKLASLYRVIDLYGWNHGTCYNHVSVRVNNSTDQFLIKPIGLAFHEITGSSLVKIDANGGTLDPGSTTFGVNALSFSLYSSIYKNRSDINCLIHVQTPAVTAVSTMKCGLLSLCQRELISSQATTHSINIDSLTNHLTIDDSIQQSTAKVLILPNYGILACGSTIEEAWHITFHLILACETQLRVASMGMDNIILSSKDSSEKITNTIRSGRDSLKTSDVKWAVGELEWSTLMIVLDRAGYHTGYIYREPLIRFIDKQQ